MFRSIGWYDIGLFLLFLNLMEPAILQASSDTLDLKSALRTYFGFDHFRGEQAIEAGDIQSSELLFDKAAEYWKEALRLAPTNYIEAQNWLKTTGRMN